MRPTMIELKFGGGARLDPSNLTSHAPEEFSISTTVDVVAQEDFVQIDIIHMATTDREVPFQLLMRPQEARTLAHALLTQADLSPLVEENRN